MESAKNEEASQQPVTPDTQEDRDRFDKFTSQAKNVLTLSLEEALRFQHNYVGTEHLLLGLIREGEA